MATQDNKPSPFFYRVTASGLSGRVRKPFERTIEELAEVSVSTPFGFANGREAGFNLDEAISVSSAYTLVAAREDDRGSILTLATAVVEDLNILEVVTARRVVAQMMVTFARNGSPPTISLAGSRLEGLRLPGHDSVPTLNLLLQPPSGGRGGPELRAASPLGVIETETEDVNKCATNGHIVDIPGFGKITFGALTVKKVTVKNLKKETLKEDMAQNEIVELVSVCAELSGLVCGQVTGPRTMTSGGGGSPGDKIVHS